MSERVTIVFNNLTRQKLPYRIWGWTGTASGRVVASGVCSGQQNTFVVSGCDEYLLSVDPQLHTFSSAAFDDDTQVSLVFGATA